MDHQLKLDSIVKKWELLRNPFYKAWSKGVLTVEAIQLYASEYSHFIKLLPIGWKTIQDEDNSREEEEHSKLWDKFSTALGARITKPSLQQTITLVEVAKSLFSSPATSLGSLYAFESQQPATAKSKLEGLIIHYKYPQLVQDYFKIHAENWNESAKLLDSIGKLSYLDQSQVVSSCEEMSSALWNALTGIYEQTRVV